MWCVFALRCDVNEMPYFSLTLYGSRTDFILTLWQQNCWGEPSYGTVLLIFAILSGLVNHFFLQFGIWNTFSVYIFLDNTLGGRIRIPR